MKLAWSENGNLKAVTFDATTSDTHLWSATVTEHPVEKGNAISDHVRPGAFKLSIEVIVTNTPLSLPATADDSFTDGVTQSTGPMALGGNLGSATVFQWSAQFDRVRKVYDGLTNLISNPPQDGITVLSSLALYDSMQIVGISVPRNAEMGRKAIKFTIELQQVTTVESQTVAAPAPKIQPKHKGHKATKQETDPKRTSLLHNATGSTIPNFFGKLGGS